MPIEDLWPLAETLRQRLTSLHDPAAGRVAADLGLNAPGWTLLLRAQLMAPQAVSASRLSALNPYVNPWTYEAGLQHLVSLGLLAPAAEGAYTVTSAGQSALTSILYAIYDCLRELVPAGEAAHRLVDLLQPLVSASLLAPEPPRKSLLRLSHELAASAPPEDVMRIDQALADLAAYHEDAHVSAWQPHMISGLAWDALAALNAGTSGTLDELYARLGRRGWPRDACARALQELVRQGWVDGPEPYALNTQGRIVHDRAAAQANAYFFAPWQVLAPRALSELRECLQIVTAAVPVAVAPAP